MRLYVKRLGRIREAEIELCPLTVFVGANGTNKTWTAYALYALARKLAWFFPFDARRDRRDPVANGLATERSDLQAIEAASANASADVSFDLTAEEVGLHPERELVVEASPEELARVIGLSAESIGNASAKLAHSFSAPAGSRRVHVNLSKSNRTWSIRRDEKVLSLVANRALNPAEFSSELLRTARAMLSPVATVAAFPAERKALSLVANHHESASRLSTVLEDYRDLVAMIASPDNPRALESLVSLEAAFSSKFLGGKVVRQGDEVPLSLALESGKRLPIVAAASLVRAFLGIGLYLRGIAQPGDMVVIDEIEMNAHPLAQLALVELAAGLANNGIWVILTTHSPYVLDHINNLVEAGRLPSRTRKKAAAILGLTPSASWISPEAIGVYEFGVKGRSVQVNRCQDEDGLVSSDTFSKVTVNSERIFHQIMSLGR